MPGADALAAKKCANATVTPERPAFPAQWFTAYT